MSWESSLDFLKLKSKEAIESTAELEQVVNAIYNLKRSGVQFKSTWGLGQAVLSVICQSCKAVPVNDTEADLFPLLHLGILMCPVDTAPRLAEVVQYSLCEEKPPCDFAALASELVRSINENNESEMAKSIVFHYLLTWELLLKQRKVKGSTFIHCARFIGLCLGELHARQTSNDEKEGECIERFCCQWQTNLIAYGLISFSCADVITSFIADLLSPPAKAVSERTPTALRAILLNNFQSPSTPKLWVSLMHCFLDGALKYFREKTKEGEDRVKDEDVGKKREAIVKDELAEMVTHEPPFLSEHFDAPLNITNVESTIRILEKFCKEESGRQRLALQGLLDHVSRAVNLSRCIADVVCQEVYYNCFQTAPLYNYIHATVSAALREGRVEIALALLEKAVGDTASRCHHQWVGRLRRWVKNEPLYEPQKNWFEKAHSPSACHTMAPLFSVFAQDAAPRLDVGEALDILVGPAKLESLRLVCHTILHEPTCDWVPQLLRDPCAPFFIHEALARLTMHYIEATDLPLARHYLASLIACVAHHVTSCGVKQVMNAMHAFAMALRGTSSPKTVSFWEQVQKSTTAVDAEKEGHTTESAALGRAFDERVSFFHSFHDGALHASSALQYEKPYTLVQVHILDSDTVLLKRKRYNDCFNTRESSVEVPIASASDFSRAVDNVRRIALVNKRQLSAGVDTSSALEERSGTQLNESSSRDGVTSKRAEKEKWWKRRFDLDMELRQAMLQLEVSLGVSRLLLLGELDLPLRLQLHAIGEQLALSIMSAMEHKMASVSQEKLQSFILLLLQGLPYLYHTPHECEVKVSSRIRYARRFLLYNPSHAECASCSETRQRLSVLLQTYVEKFIGENPRQPISPTEATETITTDRALYDDAVSASLEAFYTSLDSFESESLHAHKDLRLYPRQHLHLAIHSALQAVPWEALDVTTGQHISRVPSEAYLAAVVQRGEVARGLGSVFLYGDTHHEATKMERFEPILQAHSQWSSSTDLPEASSSVDSLFLTRLLRDSVSLYVFAGHKKGEQLISRAHLYDRFPTPQSRFPSVLLMGCGSAATRGGPKCDSYGMPFAYLHAGAPAFVGCLWDVTDGEIDKLTCSLLTSLEARGSLLEALASSRGVCKLPYLSAAATVLYGVDVKFS